ncbi:MAG: hypothetical protein GX606_05455 [Elusimicrobia bacterium]|nr:hypothetical protein [Elusimicrobiota bacterium]
MRRWGLLAVLLFVSSVGVAQEPCVYDPHGQRDPFWPLVSDSGAIINYEVNFSASEMALEGIMSGGEQGVAIINGEVMTPGQMLGAYQVDRIFSDSVVLIRDGQETELRLKKED